MDTNTAKILTHKNNAKYCSICNKSSDNIYYIAGWGYISTCSIRCFLDAQ